MRFFLELVIIGFVFVLYSYINKPIKTTCFKFQSCPNECGTEAKTLACQISQLRKTGRITLASGHPSQVRDNAFAVNNIEDSCNGGKAKRSSYTRPECKAKPAPGGSVCLHPVVLKYVLDVASRGNVKVNEFAGACHSCTSKHYDGKAVDLSLRNEYKDRAQDYMDTCEKFGGWKKNHGSHIHCQFRV